MCGHPAESLNHALHSCPTVSEIWVRFRALRASSSTPDGYSTWHEILYGKCQPPGSSTIETRFAWDASNKITVSSNTAWELLRACLLWFTWVEKCSQELNGKTFSVGKALFYAWKTTIQIGMEVWNELYRHKRGEERQDRLLTKFTEIWTKDNLFATMEIEPKWNTIPPAIFLPPNLATDNPRFLQQIPTRSTSPSTASVQSIASDLLGAAIDALFDEVNEEIQSHNHNPHTVPPSQDQAQLPFPDTIEETATQSVPAPTLDPNLGITTQDQQIQDDATLQQEIDALLRTVEEDRLRHATPEPPPDNVRMMNETERAIVAYHSDAPYSREELPAVVSRARRNPRFRGLAALEIYASVAQQLSDSDYRIWMADGLGYFNLGPRHPR